MKSKITSVSILALTLLSLSFASSGFALTLNEPQKLLAADGTESDQFGWPAAFDADTARLMSVRS